MRLSSSAERSKPMTTIAYSMKVCWSKRVRRELAAKLGIAGTLLVWLLIPQESSSLESQPAKPIQFAVVTLNEVPAAQTTSGSVVQDPSKFSDIPGLRVTTFEVPKTQGQVVSPEPSSPSTISPDAMLEGIITDFGDGKNQPANNPLVWTPRAGSALQTITFFLIDHPDKPIATRTVPIDQSTVSAEAADSTPGVPSGISNPTPPTSSTVRPTAWTPCTMPQVAPQGSVVVAHGGDIQPATATA